MKEKTYISRKEQAVLTKKKIFDTTVLLIKKKGYNKITIREICQTAEISVGTFYLYFLSKDDILLDIYNRLLQELPKYTESLTALSDTEQVLSIVSYFLEQLHTAFEKDLIREIYRINLSSNNDPLLAKGSVFCEQISGIFLRSIVLQNSAHPIAADRLCEQLIISMQGHLFHWLLSESDDFSRMTAACLDSIRQLLSPYFP